MSRERANILDNATGKKSRGLNFCRRSGVLE